MLFICFANIPLFYIYTSYDAHKIDAIAMVSLGNMGGALAICSHAPHSLPDASLSLECPSGRFEVNARGKGRKPILQMGILNKDELEVNACGEELLHDPYSCS